MAKNTYNNKFDTVIEVADKTLLFTYFKDKGVPVEEDKELSVEYVHNVLDKFGEIKSDDDRLDIAEEIECVQDLAEEFFEQTREQVLEDPKNNIKWTKNESNETVILRILLTDEKKYKLIYDLFLCDKYWAKLHHYFLDTKKIKFDDESVKAFTTDLREYLISKEKDPDCDIRKREYKGRQYILMLRGDEQKTITIVKDGQKKRRVFRPAKEDMVVYDKEHSVIAMTSTISSQKDKLFYANTFNKHILCSKKEIDKEFFSSDKYLIDLAPLLTKKFYERTKEISEIRLTRLLAIKETSPQTTITFKSDDVLKSLDSLSFQINKQEIIAASFELQLDGKKRAIPVRLTKRSIGQIKKTKERELVEDFLRTKDVISF